MKNKPPLQITLVDLVNIDYAYAYFYTCFVAVFLALCIDAKYLSNWPKLALTFSYSFQFGACIFMQYVSIGIVIRFAQIMQGHMDGFCGLLDDDFRIILRIMTASFSKFNIMRMFLLLLRLFNRLYVFIFRDDFGRNRASILFLINAGKKKRQEFDGNCPQQCRNHHQHCTQDMDLHH